MNSPTLKKEVQKWNNMLVILNIFISKPTHHILPFYRLLRMMVYFEWTPDYEEVFKSLKKTWATPLVLTRPLLGKTLNLYIAITEETINVVLIRELEFGQILVYFVSKVLDRAKTQYHKIEKIALVLVTKS